jgi:hypothetical protein
MNRVYRVLAAGLLVAVAWMLFHSRSMAWGGGDAPDGTRFKVSPVGISHVLQPHQPVSPTVDCFWSPPSGNAELCATAPGAAVAFRGLRVVSTLPLVAAALALASAATLVRATPGAKRLRIPLMIGAMLLALAAPALLLSRPPGRLQRSAVLPSGLAVRWGSWRWPVRRQYSPD